MIQHRLERSLARRATLLGVGPMSVNCVDATLELANQHDVLLMLIASRRQIDSAEFTRRLCQQLDHHAFARYVIDRDKKGKVFLARDHGGPWQNPLEVEKNLSLRRAMESAKASFAADLEAGFQILHIDPSLDIHGQTHPDEVLDRIFELYEFCCGYARRLGREVMFEIGTESKTAAPTSCRSWSTPWTPCKHFCKKNKCPFPLFVVVQVGTPSWRPATSAPTTSPSGSQTRSLPRSRSPRWSNSASGTASS